ncbi:MAG: amino acid permease [Immundisolibacter sp.]|uniref:amino acid permease n=1 Tax=Immundisolibacter sp. TaxID=1934948 RepID=UPI003EE0DA13
MISDSKAADRLPEGRLGAFAGVFTPSLLTILGIVLFLRLGYVVGSVGLVEALLILAAAHLISIVTSLSVAAIATNLRVKGGGDYYLISRTLGLGFGGAIGLVLFLAQAVAIGFYCIGFAEAMTSIIGLSGPWASRGIAAAAVAGLFAVAWAGADWATRFQYVVMTLLVMALVSFALGAMPVWQGEALRANLAQPLAAPPFWMVFAVFFPAVTGFTQGVSMSGDLRDPARAIPLGTFAAVGLSMVVYFAAAFLFAGAAPNADLAQDGFAMRRLSQWPVTFDAGVIAATLSSALASFLGAPRILQAMGRDEVLPLLRPFAVGSGASANPRRAVLLAGAIALTVVLAGSLNAVAALVSMWFLLSYGLLNYATWYEAQAASPAFRPSFRFFSRRVSLVGAVGCLAVMAALNLTAAIGAAAIVFAVYQYVRLRAVPARWADSRRSFHLHRVRQHLLAAEAEPARARDWRPQLLVFSDDQERRERLLKFAQWVEGGAGLVSVVRVLEMQGARAVEQRAAAEVALRQELSAAGSSAQPLVVSTGNLDEAIGIIVQSAGIGPLRVNTAVVNWMKESSLLRTLSTARFGGNLRTAFRLGCNLLMLDANDDEWKALNEQAPQERRVDIWWMPGATGDLMLLLGHLMLRGEDWDGASLRVVSLPPADGDAKALAESIESRLREVRIDATVEVTDQDSPDALYALSRDASLVFMPFSIHGGRFYDGHGDEIDEHLAALPVTVLTLAAQDVALEADPDQPVEVNGGVGEAAADSTPPVQ